jgi:hypothetical protein
VKRTAAEAAISSDSEGALPDIVSGDDASSEEEAEK